jgi:hypothetical protein
MPVSAPANQIVGWHVNGGDLARYLSGIRPEGPPGVRGV